MLRIAVDCFNFVGLKGGSGGTGSYLMSLLEHLARLTPVEILASPANANLFADLNRRLAKLTLHVGETDQHVASLEGVQERADILYSPFTSLLERETYARLPAVTAIHDLQHRAMPGFFTPEERLERDAAYASAVRDADGVLTFSATERDNILRTYPNAGPVGVVAHAPFLAESFQQLESVLDGQAAIEKYGRYLLYPAVNWPHKNHFRLAEAMRELTALPGLADVKLLLTGADCVEKRDHIYRRLLQTPQLRDRVVEVGFASSRQLYQLIRGAEALVFPSLYEGFGIPVLEAMRLGTPVIASDLPVFREWLDDSYVPLTDPFSPQRMAADIGAALLDKDRLADIGRRGLVRSREFSSTRMAEETLAFLTSIADEALQRHAKPIVAQSGGQAWARTPGNATLHIDIDSVGGEDLAAIANTAHLLRPAGGTRGHRLHFLVSEKAVNAKTKSEIGAVLGAVGVVSFYDPANPMHRELAVRFQITSYDHSQWHMFLTGKVFASLPQQPAWTFLTADSLFRVFDEIDGYYLGAKPWRDIRKSFFDIVHAEPEKLAALQDREADLGADRFLVSTAAARRVGGDPFIAAFRASLIMEGRLNVPRRRFAYVEPELVRYVGHHYGLTRNICRVAAAAGFDCIVGAGREWAVKIDGVDGNIPVLPLFSSYRDAAAPTGASSNFVNELIEFLRQSGLGSTDLLYLHMPYPTVMLGVLEAVCTLPLDELPTFCIRLCTDDNAFQGHDLRLTRVIASMDRLGAARRAKIRFFVESVVLQRHFLAKTGHYFPILLNPISSNLAVARMIADERRRSRFAEAPLVFGYFGEAREEKGFLQIPDIVEIVLQRCEPGTAQFHIQVSASPQNDNDRIRSARDRLGMLQGQFGPESIILHDEFGDMDSYYRALAQCDAVLLPYSPKAYETRGSGVALESLLLSCPIVVTQGTDMAETFAGDACIGAAYNARDFAERCSHLVRVREGLAQRTANYVAGSPLFRTDQAFMDILSTPQGDSDGAEAPVVLWIGNDVLAQGVSAVYKAQRAFFRRQNYEIFNLYVPYPEGNGYLHSDVALERYLTTNALGWHPGGYDFDCYSWIANQKREDARIELLDDISRHGASFERLNALNSYAQVSDALRRLLANRHVDVVCVNYVHLLPIVEELGLAGQPGTRVILETHDIQGYQHAIRSSRKPDADEIDRELAAMAAADRLVAISRREFDEIHAFDSRYRVHFVLPTIVIEGDQLEEWRPGETHLQTAELQIWQGRSDLQAAYDLRSAESLVGFRQWIMMSGHREYPVLAALAGRMLAQMPLHPDFPVAEGLEVSTYLGLIWWARADLQAAFPEAKRPDHPDRAGLLRWFASCGVTEHGVLADGTIPASGASAPPAEPPALVEAMTLARPAAFLNDGFLRDFAAWTARHPRFDVLIVGSDHPSNVRSITWFLANVYQPLLRSANIGLVIAGRVCRAIQTDPASQGALLLHEVDSLTPLYRIATVVAAPVITGTGTPIKVLDALARGLCLTVSSFVDSALGLSEHGFPLCQTPDQFAADIVKLLQSDEARAQRRALARSFAAQYLTEEAYARSWCEMIGMSEYRDGSSEGGAVKGSKVA